MADPLALIRAQITSDADAIRWACVLEATAPKVGNVHPSRSFDDLRYADFIVAANVSAEQLTRTDLRLSQRMFNAVEQSRRATGTNVNLGIVLLLGPLVAAESCETDSIAKVMDTFSAHDGRLIFDAIRVADAGGLGASDSMDVTTSAPEPVDLLAAMKHAESYDRIAKQYAGNFADLFNNVVPVVDQSIRQCDDTLAGVVDAHLELLSRTPDTLIIRKCGNETAEQVRQRAIDVDRSDPDSVAQFDRFLRRRGNDLNPGTSADLIAAALYVLLQPPLTPRT